MAHPSPGRTEFVLAALDQFESRLTRYAARLLDGDLETARDVVQHCFLQLCRQDPERIDGRLAPWLFQVCRHRAIDELRRKTRGPQTDSEGIEQMNGRTADPSVPFDADDFLRLVYQLISGLPKGEREVAELWAQQFSNQEIAEITGRSEGAIRVGLHRAMKQIRKHPSVRQWLTTDRHHHQQANPCQPTES